MTSKKVFKLFALLLSLLLFASCGNKPAETTASSPEEQASSSENTTISPDAPKDKSGKYVLNDNNEAVLNDVTFYTTMDTSDNARVFYEIFPCSFSDSNGDGIGDLKGIIERIDYLNDGDPDSGVSLGVEGIWLTPVFTSPSYHKYDVTDYYTIDPSFGTNEDMKALIDACHERNIKIILDLPINHTGRKNAWFQSFWDAHKNEDTQDPYYDFYSYYSDGEKKPQGRYFSKLQSTSDYYECNFSGDMPELNFDSEAVREEVVKIAKYWLDMGVDGFRFDAAKYVYLGEDKKGAEFWVWYTDELRKIKSDIYLVAEVWDSDSITAKYYPAMNCFNFTVSQVSGTLADTAKMGNVNLYTAYVEKYLKSIEGTNPDAMYLPFLANHDTDRAAGFLTEASGQIKMAANLYILGPGSPFIYYGEEMGIRGSRGSANTDANRRLKMLWGDGDTVKDPEGADYESQTTSTVKDQLADGNSLLSYYKKLIMIRKANPEIARGTYEALKLENTNIGGFISTYEGESVMVLHNTTQKDALVDLSTLSDKSFTTLAAVIGVWSEDPASLDGKQLFLPAQTTAVLR